MLSITFCLLARVHFFGTTPTGHFLTGVRMPNGSKLRTLSLFFKGRGQGEGSMQFLFEPN